MADREESPYDMLIGLWGSIVDKHEDSGYVALSPSEKTIWDVWSFAQIAMNEGFCPYLRATAGEDVGNLLASLERVGATAVADDVRKMCGAFPDGMPSTDKHARLDELESVAEGACERLVGKEFYIDDDELAELLCTFLKKEGL